MSFNQLRKLPTFRFDENGIQHAMQLHSITSASYEEYLKNLPLLEKESEDAAHKPSVWLPPHETISSIVKVNSRKRQKAFLSVIENAGDRLPPETMISSIMNYGAAIPGVVDGYLDADYPSHEVFAYNRLGKTSMLNRKFGEKCIEAMGYAYPGSIEEGQFENLRARVHRIIDTSEGPLAVVSTKETIDRRTYNDRTSLLISRVTGVARLQHEDIDPIAREAIETLAVYNCSTERLMGAKAVLTDFVQSHDDSDAIVPVIQTMYQTQR